MPFATPAELSPIPRAEAPRDCPLCPRLVAFRHECRAEYPDWWNAPVPAFGDAAAWVGIVGLAPGKHGANRTGRPFTGDYAGELLYATLLKFGLAEGEFKARPDDGLKLNGAVILNAVKCLPPANKPTPDEVRRCNDFLSAEIAATPSIRVLLALGRVAHESVLRTFERRLSRHVFAHGAEHPLSDDRLLIDSYHCSRYNTQTGRLTAPMFREVVARAALRAGL